MAIDTSSLIETCDPYVWIEEQREGYVRYINVTSGRRWEVLGTCIQLGYCWIGSQEPRPTLDCPVTPEFEGCCPFTFVELTAAAV